MSLLTLQNKTGEGGFSLSRLLFTLFILLLLISSGCGLPTYSYLYPPTDVYTTNIESDTHLIFRNAYENNENIFSGYEIYYKIYDPEGATSGTASYEDDYNSIENNSSADYSTLNSKGFSRLFTTTDSLTSSTFVHSTGKPAFPLDSSLLTENFRIRMIFNQELDAGNKYIIVSYDSSVSISPVPNIYRYVTMESDSTEVAKQFDPENFDINDSDLPDSIVDVNSTDYLYITFYIMSYGRDLDDLTESIYSTPVYLGTLKFECDLQDDYS